MTKEQIGKEIKELGWIIGQTVITRPIELQKQKEYLQKIASHRFGNSGYMFVNTLDGQILINNGKIVEAKLFFNQIRQKT